MKLSLGNGRDTVAIPGPSIVPDRVLAAMHRAMPNIYEGELIDISNDVLERLPALARTSGTAFVTVSNGHGAWEMAITNTLSRGDKVLVLESGRFATAWGEMAAFAGVKTEVLNAPDRGPVDPAAVEAHLRGDTGREIKAVFVVQVDTASSVINDIAAIRRAIDAADHPALLMVDCIASIGCERYEMDAWGVDVTVAGSQKRLDGAARARLRLGRRQRALAAHVEPTCATGYWDWTARMQEGAHYLRYCGTPPVSHLYGMHEALDLIDEEGGLDAVWERHAVLAAAVHAAVEAWSTPGGLELNIADPGGPVERRDDDLDRHDRRRAVACGRGRTRSDAGRRHRRVRGAGVPHRAYGPPQPADAAGHVGHDRGRVGRHGCAARRVRRGGRRRLDRRRPFALLGGKTVGDGHVLVVSLVDVERLSERVGFRP